MTFTPNSCTRQNEQTVHPAFPSGFFAALRHPAKTLRNLQVEDVALDILPGTVIGKYEIQEQLGRGGQAHLFRAWDSQLQRDVVIKFGNIPVEAESAAHSRMMQEGAILARLDHPGLARVHDCGTIHNIPYLVLEYLRGSNLQQFAQQTLLGRRQISQILDELSAAVAAVHEAGFLHLDLKPENVMITPDGHCRLIDFGLACRRDFPVATPRVIAGTREFLSPEQAAGDSQNWSEATDVFGLGGVLCQLLTGRPPLPSDWIHPHSLPEHLSATQARLAAPSVDPRLGKLCCQALSLTPEDRFASMREFRRNLHRHQRRLERWLASLLILTGLFLLCLGIGVHLFRDSGSNVDLPKTKDFSRSRLSLPVDAHINLNLEVHTASPLSPQLMIWTPSLGLREISGLKREGTDSPFRWHPRTLNGILSLNSPDETLCLMTFDAALDRGRRNSVFQKYHLEKLLARFRTGGQTIQRTSTDFLLTSRIRISSDLRETGRLKSSAAQLTIILEELGVPYQCLLLTRSVHQQPVWELDLSLQLPSQTDLPSSLVPAEERHDKQAPSSISPATEMALFH